MTWAVVDFKRGIQQVHGSRTEAAHREVPLIPAAKAFLERLHAGCQNAASVAVDGVPHVDPKGGILAVGEARKSLARACKSSASGC